MKTLTLQINTEISDLLDKYSDFYPDLTKQELVTKLLQDYDTMRRKQAAESFEKTAKKMQKKFKKYVEDRGIDYSSLTDEMVLELIENA